MLKSFFKHYINQSSKKVHMQPDFEKRLDKMLFPHAAPTSFLSLISTLMKRYSFPALATLTLLVFVITSVIKTPLEPQEVLAKALENYESAKGEVYHEEVLVENYEKGQKINSYLYEIYKTKNGLKYLQIDKDPQTQKMNSVYLNLMDEFGDSQSGLKDYHEAFSEQKLSYKDFEEEMKATGKYDWFDTFKGEKIYCVDVFQSKMGTGKAYLTLAKEDYSVYQVTELTTFQPTEDEMTKTMNELTNLERNPIASKKYIQKLIQEGAYNYSQVEEEGKKYHLFKLNDANGSLWFYFSVKNDRLAHYDGYIRNPNQASNLLASRTTILKSEFIPEENFPDLFDPNRFEGLELFPDLGSEMRWQTDTTGCYDYKGNALNRESVLKQVPQAALKEWRERGDYLQSELELASNHSMYTEFLPPPIEADPELNLTNVHFPVGQNALMTQGYHLAHLALDFSIKGEGDREVYSALEGVVTEVKKDGENRGYGATLVVETQMGDKKIQIRYAHLNQINVSVGDEVASGEIIATMGRTGHVPDLKESDMLHFEVILNGKRINPNWLFN